MSPFHQDESLEKLDFLRASVALLLLAGLFALLAMMPKRDPTKVVAGVPCSIVSESQVGDVFGMRMRLMPTEGTICHYVAANTSQQADLFVIATPSLDQPSDAVLRVKPAPAFARRGGLRYEFVAMPEGADAATAVARERRLAAFVTRKELAQQ
jgi:hypothetical protein